MKYPHAETCLLRPCTCHVAEIERLNAGWLAEIRLLKKSDDALKLAELDRIKQQKTIRRQLKGIETLQRYLAKWTANHLVDWAELPLAARIADQLLFNSEALKESGS